MVSFLMLLLITTMLYHEATAALYLSSNPSVSHQRIPLGFKSCHCKESLNHPRIKRSKVTQSNTDWGHHSIDEVPNFAEKIEKEDFSSPENFHIDTAKDNDENNPEIVGIAGLARLHAIGTRAKLRGLTARTRARAHLRHPLLLQETPKQFLDDEVKQSDESVLQGEPDFSQKPLGSTNFNQLSPTMNQQHPKISGTDQSASQRPSKLNSRPLHDHVFVPPLQMQPPTSVEEYFEEPNTNSELWEQSENDQGIVHNQEIKLPHSDVSETTMTRTPNALEGSTDYKEDNQNYPSFATVPLPYNQEPKNQGNVPQIYIHNIDTAAEGCANKKPSFSIIPPNWKPPVDSNLYHQSHYQQQGYDQPMIAVLPGKWKNGNDYDTYYKQYDMFPVAYNIPDDAYQHYYGRSAGSAQNPQNAIPQQFVGVKQKLQGWENNPLVWRPTDEAKDAKQRVAEPHFHHDHSHSHSFIHHILNHGKPTHFVPPNHEAGFSEHHDQVPHFESHGHSSGHSAFSHSQNQFGPQIPHSSGSISEHQSSFGQSQAHSHSSGFSEEHGSHGHQLTINKQHTTVIVPPGGNQNFQIAQVAGNNNAASQAQNANQAQQHSPFNGGFLPSTTQNIQSAQVSGNHNSVSQSQNANQAPFVSRQSDPVLGAPFLVFTPKRRKVLRDSGSDAGGTTWRIVIRRSVDGNNKINTSDNGKRTDVQAREKRNVPMLRLIADPNAKVDMPKTLENMGTVVRNSFEDKRRPVYHVKKGMGSARDAFLATLKITPQDFLIPSKYKIVDRESLNAVQSPNPAYQRMEQNVGAINPSLLSRARSGSSLQNTIKSEGAPNSENSRIPDISREFEGSDNFGNTYKKVGSMLRESVHSGQEALGHVGEVWHSARKALATSRHAAPRIVVSSLRIPAVQHRSPLLPQNNEIAFLTPDVVQLKQEAVNAPRFTEEGNDFVRVGHVMDSLGFSNPNADRVGLRRTVLHPSFEKSRQPSKPVIPNSHARSRFVDSNQKPALDKIFPKRKLKKYGLADTAQAKSAEQNFQETVDELNNAKDAIGAKTLKDFILQMKNGFSKAFKQQFDEARKKFAARLAARKESVGNIRTKSGSVEDPAKAKFQTQSPGDRRLDTIDTLDMVVSLASNLTNDLQSNLYDDKPTNEPIDIEHLQEEEEIINFLTELFNSQANASNNKQKQEQLSSEKEGDNIVGAGLPLSQQLLKPFMGRPSKTQLRKFLEEYGHSVEASEENQFDGGVDHQQLETSQEVIGAINSELLKKYCNENVDSEGNSRCKGQAVATDSHPSTAINSKVAERRKYDEVEANDRSPSKNETEAVGISMHMGKALLTPFMGKLVKEEVQVYPNAYNNGYENYYQDDDYRSALNDNNHSNNESSGSSGVKVPDGSRRQETVKQFNDAHGAVDENTV